MIILTLRSDKPEAEIGLFNDEHKLGYETWEAHRKLAETLHAKIETLLGRLNKTWDDIGAIVVYSGPGSFTGLRIGISAANALAYANHARIVGSGGDDWLEQGIQKILSGEDDKAVLPQYGSEAHITQSKK